jgi:uncharacterized membrane protein
VPACFKADDGIFRLWEEPVDFAALLSLSYDPIIAYGTDSAMVILHVLEALARLGQQNMFLAMRDEIREKATQAEIAARRLLTEPADLARIETALRAVEISYENGEARASPSHMNG